MKRLAFLLFLAIGCKKDAPPALPEPLLAVPSGFPQPIFPVGNELTEARWKLGKRLFFDPILSSDSTRSCASCHAPHLAFSDSTATSFGVKNRLGTQNAPSLANIAYHPYFTREGGVPTLEQQILVPIQEHNEFDFNILLVVERLRRDSFFLKMSREAYDREPDPFIITHSIACFERTILSGQSRYDEFRFQGKTNALTVAERSGLDLFFSKKKVLLSFLK